MADSNKVDFYAGKPVSLPRFVYRRLVQALRGDPAGRTAALEAAVAELLGGQDPDLRKFKFSLPDPVRALLTAEEIAWFEGQTAARRARAAQLQMVYPHAGDEFSLDERFLASVLNLDDGPRLGEDARFFTVGSCFARNIAEYLARNGRRAKTFPLAEDLNSPISNAFIFDLVRRAPAEQAEILDGWVRRIFPEIDAARVAAVVARQAAGLADLAGNLAEADCVVLTLGNVVDFFREDVAADAPLMEKLVPKFVAMPGNEDIAVRSGAAQRLRAQGAALRLATGRETEAAISACIAGIRGITAAPIVVTLSPVPVDSVIGLVGGPKSAIEVDCVSKARLRSTFDEAEPRLREAYGPLHYFPSFEIVRWIGPMLPIPTFGFDDAASRHVSSPILDAVCGLFLSRFVRRPDETAATAAAGS